MSIRSRLVIQPKTKFNSNNEQLFNAADFSHFTFNVILPTNPHSKTLQILNLIQKVRLRIRMPKNELSKYY